MNENILHNVGAMTLLVDWEQSNKFETQKQNILWPSLTYSHKKTKISAYYVSENVVLKIFISPQTVRVFLILGIYFFHRLDFLNFWDFHIFKIFDQVLQKYKEKSWTQLIQKKIDLWAGFW
jgi:uncharacterized membrane protein